MRYTNQLPRACHTLAREMAKELNVELMPDGPKGDANIRVATAFVARYTEWANERWDRRYKGEFPSLAHMASRWIGWQVRSSLAK